MDMLRESGSKLRRSPELRTPRHTRSIDSCANDNTVHAGGPSPDCTRSTLTRDVGDGASAPATQGTVARVSTGATTTTPAQ